MLEPETNPEAISEPVAASATATPLANQAPPPPDTDLPLEASPSAVCKADRSPEETPQEKAPPDSLNFTNDPPPVIKQMIKHSGDKFEQIILAGVIFHSDLRRRLAPILCVHPDDPGKSWEPDFHDARNQSLYRAHVKWIEATDDTTNLSDPFPKEMAEEMLTQLANHAECLDSDEIPETLEHLERIKELGAQEYVRNIVERGFIHWWEERRFQRVKNSGFGPTVIEAQSGIEKIRAMVKGLGTGLATRPFGEAITSQKEKKVRYSSGLNGLDRAMGGGFAKGECSILGAATGVGKTVCACQFAGTLATQGLNGLLITTEEPQERLEARIISNLADVPYNNLLGNFEEAPLTGDQRRRCTNIMAKLKNNLRISEWHDPSLSVEKHLQSLIAEVGELDFVILDWIGGALDTTSCRDQTDLRLTYQAAADELARISERENVIAIATAQLNPKESRNRGKIDPSMLAECKSLPRKATNFIGMSGILAGEGDSQNTYREVQFLSVSKSRFGPGGLVCFRREFEYQRLAEAS